MTKDKPVVLGGSKILSESIRSCHPLIPDDVLSSGLQNVLNDILKSGMLSNFAKYTKKLENQLRETLEVKHALTVSNGTTGLEILLSTLPKDTEVLVPSYTFPSVVHAISLAHLKPKFVDIDRETCNISLQDVKLKINRNTTSAILAVNVFGNPCQIKELEDIAKQYQVRLFFDSAAAIGSKYFDRLLGSFGDAEVFSLSGTKVVTAGEGGIITTNDDNLAKELDCKRNYGYNKVERDCLYIGFNGKLSELNASIALWSLGDMERNIAWRRKIAEIYYQRLKKIPGIYFQKILDGCETNFCTFAIEIDAQQFGLEALVAQECLKEEGFETLRYFCPPMHLTRAYKEFSHLRLEQSETLSQRNLCLPIHTHLSAEQANVICDAIERIHLYAKEVTQKRASTGSKQPTTNKKEQGNLQSKFLHSWPIRNGAKG
ncbi:DegT/DnrJ/EryC1/StrS family aminotransferase [candidate division KSB1 bacterium]|nr:DegT/DnrJ/EryC1/StrS family aminotransferase [candidate division KSB1 bacterium]